MPTKKDSTVTEPVTDIVRAKILRDLPTAPAPTEASAGAGVARPQKSATRSHRRKLGNRRSGTSAPGAGRRQDGAQANADPMRGGLERMFEAAERKDAEAMASGTPPERTVGEPGTAAFAPHGEQQGMSAPGVEPWKVAMGAVIERALVRTTASPEESARLDEARERMRELTADLPKPPATTNSVATESPAATVIARPPIGATPSRRGKRGTRTDVTDPMLAELERVFEEPAMAAGNPTPLRVSGGRNLGTDLLKEVGSSARPGEPSKEGWVRVLAVSELASEGASATEVEREPPSQSDPIVGSGTHRPEVPRADEMTSPAFDAACEKVRSAHNDLLSLVVRQYVVVADLVAEAKELYDSEHGTGQRGVQNPEGVPGFLTELRTRTGISESMGQKYLRVSKLTHVQRQVIAEHANVGRNFTALLELARESDPEKMLDIVMARDERGRKRLDKEVEREPLFERATREPDVKSLLKQFVDPEHVLGGLGREIAVPPDLVAKLPELGRYATIGDVRDAIEQSEQKRQRGRSGVRAVVAGQGDPLASGIQRTLSVVRLHPGPGNEVAVDIVHQGKRHKVHISVTSVKAPRAIMEEALARTAETGETRDAQGTLTGTHAETQINHARPELSDAIVTLILR